jgi:hypothetical protein
MTKTLVATPDPEEPVVWSPAGAITTSTCAANTTSITWTPYWYTCTGGAR